MRKIIAVVAGPAAFATVASGAVIIWRHHPRIGTGFMNSVVDPALLRRGLAGGEASEIGTLEHLGRRSGIRRLTPVHPEPTADGFRILVPLGPNSQWARNVLAAGHCRLQLRDVVYDLDEPAMIPAGDIDALPWVVRRGIGAVGFQYLFLRTFRASRGTLELQEVAAPDDDSTHPDRSAVTDVSDALMTPPLRAG